MQVRRKENETKGKWKRLAGWIPVLLLLFALIVLVNLRITKITVTGNKTCDAETVIEQILPEGPDRNPVVAVWKKHFGTQKQIPFISSYDVRLTGPDSCEIVVYEKTPLGYIDYMSSCMYFDKDGMIIESTDEKIDGIPEVTGLEFGSIVLGQKLQTGSVRLYDEIMNITQQLSAYGIPCLKISFDSGRNATLTIGDGSIRVNIGNDDELSQKLSAISDIYGELKDRGLKGTVDLSGYSSRGTNGFVFVPDRTE